MSGQLTTEGRKCTFNHHSFTHNSFMDAVPTPAFSFQTIGIYTLNPY